MPQQQLTTRRQNVAQCACKDARAKMKPTSRIAQNQRATSECLKPNRGSLASPMLQFPKIWGTILGVARIRILGTIYGVCIGVALFSETSKGPPLMNLHFKMVGSLCLTVKIFNKWKSLATVSEYFEGTPEMPPWNDHVTLVYPYTSSIKPSALTGPRQRSPWCPTLNPKP